MKKQQPPETETPIRLELGAGDGMVFVNLPKLPIDSNGVGHLSFFPDQAQAFAHALLEAAEWVEDSMLFMNPEGIKTALDKKKSLPVDAKEKEIT